MARGDCRGTRDRLGALGFEHADPDADDCHELRRLAQRFEMELPAPFEASN